jgi:2-polyprenyl-3-methyl-5-hydroxy-6-metoxy-1,4-benzoquinol methylase
MLGKLTGGETVCPWWLCYAIDNPLRRLLHDPETILHPHVGHGDSAIDVGAGMGYFSIPLARLVGPTGHVTAIDIQAKILSALTRRVRRAGLSDRISEHLASPESLGTHPKADFILAFFMVHEVPNQRAFLTQIHDLMKPDGIFLLAEPKLHVPKESFLRTLRTAEDIGLSVKSNPRIRMSHSVVLAHRYAD